MIFILLLSIKEPIFKVAPTLNEGDDTKTIKAHLHKNIRILCPTQAWEVPVYKWVADYNYQVYCIKNW